MMVKYRSVGDGLLVFLFLLGGVVALEELGWFFLDLVLEEVELEEILVVVHYLLLACLLLLVFLGGDLSVFQQYSEVILPTVQRKFVEFVVKCKIQQGFAVLATDPANQLILAELDKVVYAEVLREFKEDNPAAVI